MSPAKLPSNTFYKQLNRRFDRRAKLLKRLGFQYIAANGLAVFQRTKWGRLQTIAASALLGYHNRMFREVILSGYCR